MAAVRDDTGLTGELADGRRILVPLWGDPRLYNATPTQRRDASWGMQREEIDEDLPVSGLLRGARAPGAVPPG